MNELDTFQSKDFSSDYRLRVLFSMIPSGKNLLDIGSGNGIIADFLKGKFERISLLDNSDSLVRMLRKKFYDRHDVEIIQADAEHLDVVGSFDVITACDILEHLEDDFSCLVGCQHALSEDGYLFISVPAFQFLYGLRDKKYGHQRRYHKKYLTNLLNKAGFQVEDIFYWNAIGFLPYFLSERLLHKPLVAPARSKNNTIVSRIVNKFLYSVLKIEAFLKPPFGLSVIALCKRKI